MSKMLPSSSTEFRANNQREISLELSKVRILQKNIVYVIGLSLNLANEDLLLTNDCFGQYGEITKIVINKSGYTQNYQNDTTYSVYVTYKTEEQASLALLAIDNTMLDGHIVRCSYGTTKYCTFFLKGIDCINKDCLYLHKLGNEEDTVLKDDIGNKQLFFAQQKIAVKISGIFNKEKKKKILSKKNKNTFSGSYFRFPGIETIYQKENIYELANLKCKKKFLMPSSHDFYCSKKNIISSANDGNKSYENEPQDESETEYILVKENKKKCKKCKSSRKLRQKKEEDDEIRTFNLKLDNLFSSSEKEKTASTTSSSSKDLQEKLFKPSTKSRFSFILSTNSEEGVKVPSHISDMIISYLSSFSKNSLNYSSDDDSFCKEIEKIKKWTN